MQGRGGHQQLLPAGAALLGAAINQVAFRKSQHCSKFLTCLRTWQMVWTEKPKCKQNITPLQPSQTRNWVWSRQNILLETSNWFRPVLIIERGGEKKLKFYKKKPLQIGMLYFFITEMSKQTHFFLLQQHFLVKNVVTKNFQPALTEFPTDPLPSLPKLLSLFLWQLLEATTSYRLIDSGMQYGAIRGRRYPAI